MPKSAAQQNSAEYLRAAHPRLICTSEIVAGRCCKLTPYIREGENSCEEVITEGYDPVHSPLGCPVYWRIVKRGELKFYFSTFMAPYDLVKRAWGTVALGYCDPDTGLAAARLETKLD